MLSVAKHRAPNRPRALNVPRGARTYGGQIGTLLGAFASAVNVLTVIGLSGLAINDQVKFIEPVGDVLPTGLVKGTTYWVLSVVTNTFTVSTSQGGATQTVGTGAGFAYKL